MFTICWSPKGGTGTTVAAATLGVSAPSSLIVDLAGDLPAAIGAAGRPDGVLDWLRTDTGAERLDDLTIEIGREQRLINTGTPGDVPEERWAVLAEHLKSAEVDEVVVDAGTTSHPPTDLMDAADRRLMVLRPCYLSLRRAHGSTAAADGVILVTEPGRALSTHDVERTLTLPVLAEVIVDPSVARAVDAGLLSTRLPRSLSPLRRLVQR